MEGLFKPPHSIRKSSSIIWDYSNSTIPDQFIDLLRNAGLKDSDIKEIINLVVDILKEHGSQIQAIDILRTAIRQFRQLDGLEDQVQMLYLLKIYTEKLHLLFKQNFINIQILEKAIEESIKTKKSVEYILITEGKIPKEKIGQALSAHYKVPFKDFDPSLITPFSLLKQLKKSFLLNENWVPIAEEDGLVHVVMDTPSHNAKVNSIKRILNKENLVLYVGIKEDIQSYVELFYQKGQPSIELSKTFTGLEEGGAQEEDLIKDEDVDINEHSSEVVRLVDQVLINAHAQRASDIHIEPSLITGHVEIRFRIDGVLKEVAKVPLRFARPILARLKIMANLDISEKRLPQDGKIKFRRKGLDPIEIRLATIPTSDGLEDAVLRILAKAGAKKLDEMGFEEGCLRELRRVISQPYGLILVVGPTGSGKTTTLHAILGELNKPGVKIWTAEDPIEITQKGLRQVEVKPKIGLDFARVMRAFLRADPDIIMIGEMRDHETASIAVEASLTGHLVLSTLHTNSAPETITRLLDMGLNPINFSDSVLGILAQRLVRRLCNNCKEAYRPEEEEYQELTSELGELIDKSNIPAFPDTILYRAKGCHACSGIGYKGRIGIYELLVCTKKIKSLIKKGAATEEITALAKSEGMVTLKQDGIIKIFKGITDVAELKRVVVE